MTSLPLASTFRLYIPEKVLKATFLSFPTDQMNKLLLMSFCLGLFRLSLRSGNSESVTNNNNDTFDNKTVSFQQFCSNAAWSSG